MMASDEPLVAELAGVVNRDNRSSEASMLKLSVQAALFADEVSEENNLLSLSNISWLQCGQSLTRWWKACIHMLVQEAPPTALFQNILCTPATVKTMYKGYSCIVTKRKLSFTPILALFVTCTARPLWR